MTVEGGASPAVVDPGSRSGTANPDQGRLSAALNPSAIAIIGASNNPHKIGGRPLLYLSRFGYTGRVYPINPNRATVQGFTTYPDVASLPEAPELAIIAAPGPHVIQAVDACAARGVRVAIVMASGFGETADAAACAAERGMVARARAAGMRIVGPNSQGLANFGTGAVASFSTMFVEVEPADGPVGIISQSGMMSVMPYGLLRAKGIGVRHSHATGNDADVSLSELALAVVQDPAVRLLLLYIESIRDADVLARAAEMARERDLPVLAVKSGRTVRGQAAARSHTGALVNEDRVVDAFFRRHAIWRARDVHEMVSAAELYLKGWRPAGRRLVVVSNSGSSCVMAADLVQELGLDLAVLAETTVATIRAELPVFATPTNPIDTTAALLTDSSLFGRVLSVVADDPGTDLCLVGIPVAGAGYDVPAFARAAAAFAAQTDRPIVVAALQDPVAAVFRAADVPTFASQSEALAALAQLAHHTELMRRRPQQEPECLRVELPAGRSKYLSEADSLTFLEQQGLPVVPHRLCRSEAAARSAYRQFGDAVVVKGCSPALPHKSEHGLVIVDVHSEEGVAEAFENVRARMTALRLAPAVIVAPMIKGRRELVLGGRVDPIFGPVLMLGDGGKYVEAVGDVAVLLLPATVDEVRDALFTRHVAPILKGVRNEPPFDVEAFCVAAVRLGAIIMAGADDIASIDLNPVMIGRQGEGIVIVDALVERSKAGDE